MKEPRDHSLGLPRDLILTVLLFGLLLGVYLCARHLYTALAPERPTATDTQP